MSVRTLKRAWGVQGLRHIGELSLTLQSLESLEERLTVWDEALFVPTC